MPAVIASEYYLYFSQNTYIGFQQVFNSPIIWYANVWYDLVIQPIFFFDGATEK